MFIIMGDSVLDTQKVSVVETHLFLFEWMVFGISTVYSPANYDFKDCSIYSFFSTPSLWYGPLFALEYIVMVNVSSYILELI